MGDVLAPPAIDNAFGPVHMDYPIVIFQNSESSFYVSPIFMLKFSCSIQCFPYEVLKFCE